MSANGWQPIETAPKSRNVLVARRNSLGNWRIMIAAFHPRFTLESDADYAEYDEETDAYYAHEGWYEQIENWDEYSSVFVDDVLTHWRPLPEPPE